VVVVVVVNVVVVVVVVVNGSIVNVNVSLRRSAALHDAEPNGKREPQRRPRDAPVPPTPAAPSSGASPTT
jgi:hypothetical protein